MTKQLFRSRKNKLIGGVCGGLAEYFDIDPVIVRVIFIITTIGWGLGFVAYIILWIIVPISEVIPVNFSNVEPAPAAEEFIMEKKEKSSEARKQIAALVLIAIGGIWLLDNLIPFCDMWQFWPILLIGLGLLILLRTPLTSNK